jgi:DNA-binding beta-propeller fold protein YncE
MARISRASVLLSFWYCFYLQRTAYCQYMIVADAGCQLRRLDVITQTLTTISTVRVPGTACSMVILPTNDHALVAADVSIYNMSLSTGAYTQLAGGNGVNDGIGMEAKFNAIHSMALSPDGEYILLGTAGAIRKMVISTLRVTTLTSNQQGYGEGSGVNIKMGYFIDIDIDPSGSFALFTDESNGALRKLDLTTNPVTSSLLVGGLSNKPNAIAIYNKGTHALMYEKDSGRLSRIDLSTLTISHVTFKYNGNYVASFFGRIVVSPSNTEAYVMMESAIYKANVQSEYVYGYSATTVVGILRQNAIADGVGENARLSYAIEGSFPHCLTPGYGFDSNLACSPCPTNFFGERGLCSPCRQTCGSGTYTAAVCTSAKDTQCAKCTACTPGQLTASPCNATANTACPACPAGSICPNGTIPIPCAPGSACPAGSSATSLCRTCAVGQYVVSACKTTANTVCSGTHTPIPAPNPLVFFSPIHFFSTPYPHPHAISRQRLLIACYI